MPEERRDAGAELQRRDVARAPAWLVWAALLIVYVVWGSTYLAIRVVVETMPPMLAASIRFLTAGGLLYLVLLLRSGPATVGVTRAELAASVLVGGALLLGGNGMLSIAQQQVPSALAALIVGAVPLWVVLLRRVTGERTELVALGGVALGFAGVALLVIPRGIDSTGGISLVAMLMVVASSASWATGSFVSSRLPLPTNPFVSTALQLLAGGGLLGIVGVLRGEAATFRPESIATASVVGLGYLVVFGSLLAYTAYTWLLQNAPIAKVATYAYVNPVVAVILGWAFAGEEITVSILVGAVMIIGAVAFIVGRESSPPKPETREAVEEGMPGPGPAATERV